jgi:hypothetical protein
MQVSISVHREAVGLMLTNFRVGDRVEDKENHKRGRVTFVYSELEFKGEVNRGLIRRPRRSDRYSG